MYYVADTLADTQFSYSKFVPNTYIKEYIVSWHKTSLKILELDMPLNMTHSYVVFS